MKHTYLFFFFLGFLADAANAYDTGAMTCDDVGQYAAAVMTSRGNGQSKDDALAAVTSQTQWPGEVEKGNLESVVKMIHGRLGDQLFDAKAAHGVITRDCEISKRRQKQ